MLTSLDWEVRCRNDMSTSAAYYFLMTGADTLSQQLRGLCRVPLTPEPDLPSLPLGSGLPTHPAPLLCTSGAMSLNGKRAGARDVLEGAVSVCRCERLCIFVALRRRFNPGGVKSQAPGPQSAWWVRKPGSAVVLWTVFQHLSIHN